MARKLMQAAPATPTHRTTPPAASYWTRRFMGAGLGLVLMATNAWAQPAAEGTLVVRGASLLEPPAGAARAGETLVIRGGQVTAVWRPGEKVGLVDDGAVTLDLAGLTVLPGLIDLHSHLLLHPYDEASWDDQVLREQLELRTIRGVVAAQATLEAGFTTLRDLGTEGAGYADIALRDAVAQGMIPGPRLFVATRALVATGAYGPAGFDPRWSLPKGAQVADGPDGVRRAVREQIAAGADWIKIYADYRRRRGGPSTATFSPEEMTAMVHEAHTAGIPVASHASTDEAIRRSIAAGVQTIEHGYQASAEVLELMRQEGVVLCPTLAASEAIAQYRDQADRIEQARSLVQRAMAAGVTMALGSDVGVFDHGDNAREIELFVDYGMAPKDALAAATSVAAKVLRQEGVLGCLAVGCQADFIAVAGDPLQNIGLLRQPLVVVQGGRVVIDRR